MTQTTRGYRGASGHCRRIHRRSFLSVHVRSSERPRTVGRLTCRAVVANSEGDRRGGIDVAKARAVDSGASDLGGSLPDDLREVAPFLEQGHVWGGLSVEVLEVTHFIVIHQVGDHDSNFISRGTVANVLAVSATVNAPTSC